MFIEVVTRDLNNPDKVPVRQRIDYENTRARRWLAKHCHWAMRNNHSVTTAPIADSAA